MWDDMVDTLRFLDNILLQAQNTQRMSDQVVLGVFVPTVCVPALIGVRALMVLLAQGLWLMLLAIARPVVGQAWAAGLPAGTSWAVRH